jgi:hypothetical protein
MHPLKTWLINNGYTQTWLGEKLRPSRPVDQRHIYLWFSRRAKPRKVMIERMAALTRGEVAVEEIEEFHAIHRVLRSRRARGKRPDPVGQKSENLRPVKLHS